MGNRCLQQRMGLQQAQMAVIPHGNLPIAPLPLPALQPLKLLYFGFIYRGKGIEDLLEALAQLCVEKPALRARVRLTLAGGSEPEMAFGPSGSYLEQLRQRIPPNRPDVGRPSVYAGTRAGLEPDRRTFSHTFPTGLRGSSMKGRALRAMAVVGVCALTLSSPAVEAETVLRGQRAVTWKDFLGVNVQFHYFTPDIYQKQMARLDELGLNWIRWTLHWPILEPAPGQYNLADLDAAMAAAAPHHYTTVAYLVGSATFDSSGPQGASNA
nr:hypothetical protein [Tanacetum cinerariifolium]